MSEEDKTDLKHIFAKDTSGKGLLSKMQNSKNSINYSKNDPKEQQTCHKEDIQMENRYIRRFSTKHVIRKHKIETSETPLYTY